MAGGRRLKLRVWRPLAGITNLCCEHVGINQLTTEQTNRNVFEGSHVWHIYSRPGLVWVSSLRGVPGVCLAPIALIGRKEGRDRATSTYLGPSSGTLHICVLQQKEQIFFSRII